jgi:hypothetical protein
MRLTELARELGVTKDKIVEKLKSFHIKAKDDLSDSVAAILRTEFKKATAKPALKVEHKAAEKIRVVSIKKERKAAPVKKAAPVRKAAPVAAKPVAGIKKKVVEKVIEPAAKPAIKAAPKIVAPPPKRIEPVKEKPVEATPRPGSRGIRPHPRNPDRFSHYRQGSGGQISDKTQHNPQAALGLQDFCQHQPVA